MYNSFLHNVQGRHRIDIILYRGKYFTFSKLLTKEVWKLFVETISAVLFNYVLLIFN